MEEMEVRAWGKPFPEQIQNAPVDHLHIAAVINQCNNLHGKILTVIDAAYNNPQQNKAVKDIVRRMFREQMDYMVVLSDPNSDERRGCQTPIPKAKK
jgi:hypothetical protein